MSQSRPSGRGLLARPPLIGSRPTSGPFPAPRLAARPGRAWLRTVLGRDSQLRHLDWVLLAAVLSLGLMGTLLIWSATQPGLRASGGDPYGYLKKQLLNLSIGVVLMLAVAAAGYPRVRAVAVTAAVASTLGLLLVLTPAGSTVNGARSWIALPGGFQLEPSEYAKLGIIGVLAMILGSGPRSDPVAAQDRARGGPPLRAVAAALGFAAVPLALVAAQPDLGVIVLMLALVLGLIALSGVRLRWLAGLVAAGTLAAVAALQLHLLKAYQLGRLTSFLNPSADPQGTGYSAAQSKIAIGSGGLLGHGLFHGPLTAGHFVPEQHTDFIFSVAGEELGFAGTAIIIALLALVILRALRIAARAEEPFGTLVAGGVAVWFAVQAFVNIGMTVGIMPVTGLPLPFVSYGGSSMFADMIAIGMLMAVHWRPPRFV
ncbi:MAG TPA: rod shape-determining protein RodA [Streptosporangiaceae bacterium]